MSVILDLLGVAGWPLGAFFTAVTVTALYRIARTKGQHKDRGSWITALMFGCAAIADFTALGRLSVLTGSILASLVFGAFLVLAQPWRKGVARSLRSNAGVGARWLREDASRARGWFRRLFIRSTGGGVMPPEPESLAAVGAALRAVPSLREDTALGGPIPAEAIAAIPAADPARVLAEWIAAHEPETDAELLAFVRSLAAGFILISHAFYAYADRCMSDLGLDPAFAAGIGEIAEHAAELAHDIALVDHRFRLIYQQIQEWIASGRVLPANPRFLTGGDAA